MPDTDSPAPDPKMSSQNLPAPPPPGPGAVGVELSLVETRISDLAHDKTLSREQRELYRTFYTHERAKLQLQLSIFDVKERIDANERALSVAERLVEFKRSDAGREEAGRKWQQRRAGEALGAGTRNSYELSQSGGSPEAEEIRKTEAQLAEAEAVLDETKTELQTFSSTLDVLSRKDGDLEQVKVTTDKWELSREWEAITPVALRPAVAAVRVEFEHNGCWKSEQCTAKLCDAALNPSSNLSSPENAEHVRQYRQYLLALVGPKAQRSFLGPNHSAAAIFRSYLDLLEVALKNVLRLSFQDLFQIARAQVGTLSMHPAEWSKRQLQILISDRKTSIKFWIQRVCGPENNVGIAVSEDDDIYAGRWRMPLFTHMQPAGNTQYDASTARTHEGLFRTQELLERRSARVITFLGIELDRIVRDAQVELAKRGEAPPAPGERHSVRSSRRPSSIDPTIALHGHSSQWKALHDAFRSLSEEEFRLAPCNAGDQWLRGHVDYTDPAFEYGQWRLSEGIGEGFRNRFEVEATRAGLSLSSEPVNEPSEMWLHYVFGDLKEHKSELLAISTQEGGIIRRVCEGSASCCARLERWTLVEERKRATELRGEIQRPPSPSQDNKAGQSETGSKSDSNEKLREAVIRKVENPQTYTTLTTVEAALYFEVKTRTVYRWKDEGRLKNGPRRGSITISSIQNWARKRAKRHSPRLP